MSELEDALNYAQVPFAYETLVHEYLRSRQQHISSQLLESPSPCRICQGFGFYLDNDGIWHPCPKCNGQLEDQH